jgi:hypothetical protein
MNGILSIDETAVEDTTGHMLVTFKSGGDAFAFTFPPMWRLGFVKP